MDIKNRTLLASLAATLGVVIVAALGLVALSAQQGPPLGRGPGGRGTGMFGGTGGQQGRGPGTMAGPRGGPMAGMMMRGLGQLDLTDEQKEKIKGIHEAQQETMKAFGQQMRTAREALDEAITGDTVNEALIREKAAAVGALDAEAAVMQAKVHAQVFALLTPEQQAKAKELRAQAKDRIEQGRGPGMGRGMGRGGRGPGGPGRIGGWF